MQTISTVKDMAADQFSANFARSKLMAPTAFRVYRSYTAIILIIALIVCLVLRLWLASGIVAATLHLQLLDNQVWHKVRAVEVAIEERKKESEKHGSN